MALALSYQEMFKYPLCDDTLSSNLFHCIRNDVANFFFSFCRNHSDLSYFFRAPHKLILLLQFSNYSINITLLLISTGLTPLLISKSSLATVCQCSSSGGAIPILSICITGNILNKFSTFYPPFILFHLPSTSFPSGNQHTFVCEVL